MPVFDRLLWCLVGWTLIEGFLVMVWPTGMIRLTRRLFRTWSEALSTMALKDLRKIGLIEFCFGLLLGGYLLWAG